MIQRGATARRLLLLLLLLAAPTAVHPAFDTLEFAVEVDKAVRRIRFAVTDDVHAVAEAFVRQWDLREGLDCPPTPGDPEQAQRCVAARLGARLRDQVAAVTAEDATPLPQAAQAGDVVVARWSHFALVHNAAHGDFMVEDGDAYVGAKLRTGRGRYEEPTLQLLLACVAAGDVALDIGANVGAFTVPLARAVGGRGRVHAFEAQPHLANLLAANVALNIRRGVAPRTVRVCTAPPLTD
jgi:hypothetical protein